MQNLKIIFLCEVAPFNHYQNKQLIFHNVIYFTFNNIICHQIFHICSDKEDDFNINNLTAIIERANSQQILLATLLWIVLNLPPKVELEYFAFICCFRIFLN